MARTGRRRGGPPQPAAKVKKIGTGRTKTKPAGSSGYRFGPGAMDTTDNPANKPGYSANHLGKPRPIGGHTGTTRVGGRNVVGRPAPGTNRSVASGNNPGNHLGKPISTGAPRPTGGPSPAGSGQSSAFTKRLGPPKRVP